MNRHTWSMTTAIVSGAGVLLAILFGGGSRLLLDGFVAIAFGWLTYLRRVLPNVGVDRQGVATAAVCLAFFTVGLHRMSRWFFIESRGPGSAEHGSGPTWSFRWTSSLVVLLLLMFVAGVAATGIVHQTGWLVASRGELLELKPPAMGPRRSSEDLLRDLGLGVLDSRIHRDSDGTSSMSWMARLLPEMGYYVDGDVREDLPWNDPRNSAYYKGIVPAFLNPEIPTMRTAEGYGLGHYAGNVHVLGTPDESHGAPPPDSSQLIAAGEAAEGFRAWGDPSNLRDPGLGVNKVPGGFGGPSGAGAYFLFMDGSVRFMTRSTDFGILRRLSRPEGRPGSSGGPDEPRRDPSSKDPPESP